MYKEAKHRLSDFLENHLQIQKGQIITIKIGTEKFIGQYISTSDFLNAIFIKTTSENMMIPYKQIRYISVEHEEAKA